MTRWIALALFALAVAACGGTQIPGDARKTVVSLQKIDCAECGAEIVEDLRKRPGVYEATFDKKRAEIRVVASPTFDVYTVVRQLAANEGFEALLGEGQGKYLEGAIYPEGADVKTVAVDGKDVPDLAPHLVKGKVTVVDFSALWCKPCRKVDEHMAKLFETRKDIAYRKLDIGDWDTPLAQRWLKGVPQLPYVMVFGTSGAKVKDIAGLDLAALDAAIATGASN